MGKIWMFPRSFGRRSEVQQVCFRVSLVHEEFRPAFQKVEIDHRLDPREFLPESCFGGVGSFHRFGVPSVGFDPVMPGDADGTLVVEGLGYDENGFEAEDLAGTEHRVERVEPGMVADNGRFGNTPVEEGVPHRGGFVVADAPVVTAHEQEAAFSGVVKKSRGIHACGEIAVGAVARDQGRAAKHEGNRHLRAGREIFETAPRGGPLHDPIALPDDPVDDRREGECEDRCVEKSPPDGESHAASYGGEGIRLSRRSGISIAPSLVSAIGDAEKIVRQSDEVFTGTQVTLTIFGNRVRVAGEKLVEAVAKTGAFAAGPLEEFRNAPVAGSGTDRVEGVAEAGGVVPVEIRDQKLHPTTPDRGVDLLDFVNLDVPGIIGRTGNQLFDEVLTGLDVLEALFRKKHFAVRAMIEEKADDGAVAVHDGEEERCSGPEIHIGTVLKRFACVVEGADGAGKFESAVRNGVAHGRKKWRKF
jgi:hypothetical protein